MNPTAHPNDIYMKAIPDESKTNETEAEVASDKPVITWQALEYVKHEKGKTWFMIGGIVVLIVVIWGLFTNSWTMSIVALVFAVVYYLVHQECPKTIEISMLPLGIKVDKKFYPYSLISYFWVIYTPYVKTLNLKLASRTITEIEIQMGNQNPSDVRNFLLQQIPEMEGKEESFTSIMTRLLRL